jgi:signal transduction histidine kinase
MLRVLMNLCRNSATAMNNRGFIAIVCAERAGTVEFTVSDNGPGIPEDIRESVFEPFVTGGKGTGLGLAIAKRVVEEHEGTIRIDSRNGEGTTVTIAIPQEAAEETGEDS